MVHRLFWVTVGAVGGVAVYRRSSRLLADARARGMAGNVAAAVAGAQSAAVSANAVLAQARELRQAMPARRAAGDPATGPTPAALAPLAPSPALRPRRPAQVGPAPAPQPAGA